MEQVTLLDKYGGVVKAGIDPSSRCLVVAGDEEKEKQVKGDIESLQESVRGVKKDLALLSELEAKVKEKDVEIEALRGSLNLVKEDVKKLSKRKSNAVNSVPE